ncbi:MAG TPA: TadE/TadG family type IV pilus assembly protein [Caulobacteraceae bacterium]|nr:TadE/TadG family type IV pilus assembly protein [Caulobacteraceae bacterium]
MNLGSRRSGVAALARLFRLFDFARDRRGNIAAMTALLIVPLVGALGMAIETGDWYMNQRAVQNAADSAALSAGLNGGTAGGTSCSTSPGNFDCEAAATASQFGLTSGSNNVTVTTNCYATTATGSCTTTKTCPGGASQCYQVTVTKLVPVSIMGIVGYKGDATIGGSTKAVSISATAWSRNSQSSAVYCILALATSGDAISASGSPKFDSGGCSLFSDASTNCSGHSLANNVDAASTADSTCASVSAKSNQPSISDTTWKALAKTANIPDAAGASQCGGTSAAKFPGATWSTNQNFASKSTVYVCGNLTLGANVQISSASPGTTVIIYNGTLDFAGFTLSTTSTSHTTIVFTGTTLTDPGVTNGALQFPAGCTGKGKSKCSDVDYYPQGDGVLDISAPTSGTWSGVAVYVNPNLTTGTGRSIDGSFAGNGVTWDIQGLYYSPNSSMSFSGAENKDSNQLSCFSLVVKNFSTNGTGSIFSSPTNQCTQAGLVPPTGVGSTRASMIG